MSEQVVIDGIPQEKVGEKRFAALVGLHFNTVARLRQQGLITHRRAGRLVYYLAPVDVVDFHQRMRRPSRAEREERKRETGPPKGRLKIVS